MPTSSSSSGLIPEPLEYTGHGERQDNFAVRLLDLFERFGGWLNRNPPILLLAYSFLVLPFGILVSLHRAAWFDEIYTIYLSRLTMPELWKALSTTVDQQPPLSYILTRAAFSLFGESEFTSRIPSILGFWVAGLCIFRYVSIRTAPVWGFLAALLPFSAGVAYFDSEARPYGILVGFTGLAMAAWQSAGAHRFRNLSLCCLVAAIICAVSSHYYAILLIVPLFIGEATRIWTSRKVDWPLLACVTLPFGFELLFLPFIRHSIQIYSVDAWNKPNIKSLYISYGFMFGGNAPVFLAIFAVWLLVFYALRPVEGRSRRLPPLHETIAALALAMLPVPAYVVAVMRTHLLYPRYVVPLVVGCAILFGLSSYQVSRARSSFALAAAACVMTWMLVNRVEEVRHLPPGDAGCPVAPTTGPEASLPVVIDDSKAFLRCWFYADPDMKSRIKFVSDLKAAESIGAGNSVLTNLLIAGDVLHFPVVRYSDFRAAHKRFFISEGPEGEAAWVLKKYLSDHAEVQIYDKRPWNLLLLTDRSEDAQH